MKQHLEEALPMCFGHSPHSMAAVWDKSNAYMFTILGHSLITISYLMLTRMNDMMDS